MTPEDLKRIRSNEIGPWYALHEDQIDELIEGMEEARKLATYLADRLGKSCNSKTYCAAKNWLEEFGGGHESE